MGTQDKSTSDWMESLSEKLAEMASAAEALDRLCDPAAEVSAHYLIGADGTLWQLVDEARRAWHAGAGIWGGIEDVNSRSIGIELSNIGTAPFAAPLMDALEDLVSGLNYIIAFQ